MVTISECVEALNNCLCLIDTTAFQIGFREQGEGIWIILERLLLDQQDDLVPMVPPVWCQARAACLVP